MLARPSVLLQSGVEMGVCGSAKSYSLQSSSRLPLDAFSAQLLNGQISLMLHHSSLLEICHLLSLSQCPTLIHIHRHGPQFRPGSDIPSCSHRSSQTAPVRGHNAPLPSYPPLHCQLSRSSPDMQRMHLFPPNIALLLSCLAQYILRPLMLLEAEVLFDLESWRKDPCLLKRSR